MTTTTPFHLRRERERQGLTQEQLAERSGVSQSQISAIEAIGRLPTWDTACKLADALGVRLEKFRK